MCTAIITIIIIIIIINGIWKNGSLKQPQESVLVVIVVNRVTCVEFITYVKY